jgi:hypothetical protein
VVLTLPAVCAVGLLVWRERRGIELAQLQT